MNQGDINNLLRIEPVIVRGTLDVLVIGAGNFLAAKGLHQSAGDFGACCGSSLEVAFG